MVHTRPAWGGGQVAVHIKGLVPFYCLRCDFTINYRADEAHDVGCPKCMGALVQKSLLDDSQSRQVGGS